MSVFVPIIAGGAAFAFVWIKGLAYLERAEASNRPAYHGDLFQ